MHSQGWIWFCIWVFTIAVMWDDIPDLVAYLIGALVLFGIFKADEAESREKERDD